MTMPLNVKKIILASASPRRQFLLKELGVDFTVKVKSINEVYPEGLKAQEIPLYLSQQKALQFKDELDENTIVITADTIVWLQGKEIGKPAGYADAMNMLKTLSGKMHEVFTAVTLTSKTETRSFYVTTKVYFKPLSEDNIIAYLDDHKPFDKAGSYGIQDCLPADVNPCTQEEREFLKQFGKEDLYKATYPAGQKGQEYIGIEKIEGSYFNVMGFPLKELYGELKEFDKTIAGH